MMACFDVRIHLLIEQRLAPAPLPNGVLNEHPHHIPNGIPNGGQVNEAQILEKANLQPPVKQEGKPPPSHVLPHPQNIVPPHGVPPSRNPVAPANEALHHEATLEGESSHHPFTRTQHQLRERSLIGMF